MGKFKILIADDEYWTREKLRVMMDWESYGLMMFEPAQNGEEAIERIKKEQPDILITDINMPFLSGVELLREAQKYCPDLISFVISGYDDFAYVKDSFLAGSVNYLLKPVDRMELEDAIVKALELAAQRKQERKEKVSSTADSANNVIRQAAAYIEEYYFEPLTLAELAKKYHMGSSYFSKCFRKEMGENFVSYLSRTRMEKAKEFMKKKDASLAEIAFMVGYDDYIYFSKVFRKMTGVSPREYRQGLGQAGENDD